MQSSLAFAKHIMDMPLPEDPALAIKVMSLKKEVMASVLSAGVRVNDAALRKQETDKVADLLRKVKRIRQPFDEEERIKNELFS